MAFPVSDSAVFPRRSQIAHDLDEIYDDLHEFEISASGDPKILVKKESFQKEKQISVDPISLRESSRGEASFSFMLPPVITTARTDGFLHLPPPPPLPPAKPRFLSCSLPNSATSSPRFSSILSMKKWKRDSQASPRQLEKLARQNSAAQTKSSLFRRTKSCNEGRVSSISDEFDLCLDKPNAIPPEYNHYGSFSKPEAKHEKSQYSSRKMDAYAEEEFKCGALCLFLPGFSKGSKPVRERKEEEVMIENVVSRTVSLEKFECGSWASSAIMHDDDGDSTNLYFDLPLELIKGTANEADSPIAAAFVFDNDRKGVLKNVSTRVAARKSHETSRHVRFSTSSPTLYPASPASSSSCITPRLRKAREEFNAFLEAQIA